ncbi:MAG: transposase [Saprospiraceae bacterium]|nr:transposase [Saprospiraceae bacterium]|tara:strand:- start:3466 stop:3852 length:387 start_codon:yes stop_codon:yes gene_type:complete
MIKDFKQFVGIDVSKLTLDVSVIFDGESCRIEYIQVVNSIKGSMELLIFLSKKKVRLKNVLFCIEHTGLYGSLIMSSLLKKKADVWFEMPYIIKHSMGIQRGKTDKVDSLRIAQYVSRFRDKAQLYKL